jgi:hypothetical protein
MIAITTSTKYHDLLKITLPQNCRFFEKWYIITHPDDHETINVINGYSNIEMILYDFYANNKIFNKGGAIQMVQKRIPSGTHVLLLDSDIYLPDNFLELLPQLEPDKLYGPEVRHDFYSHDHFKRDKPDKIYKSDFYGFFQLYIQTPERLYSESNDASVCDDVFRDKFHKNNRVRLSIIPKHLGRDKVNWKGRNKIDFF